MGRFRERERAKMRALGLDMRGRPLKRKEEQPIEPQPPVEEERAVEEEASSPSFGGGGEPLAYWRPEIARSSEELPAEEYTEDTEEHDPDEDFYDREK